MKVITKNKQESSMNASMKSKNEQIGQVLSGYLPLVLDIYNVEDCKFDLEKSNDGDGDDTEDFDIDLANGMDYLQSCVNDNRNCNINYVPSMWQERNKKLISIKNMKNKDEFLIKFNETMNLIKKQRNILQNEWQMNANKCAKQRQSLQVKLN